MKDEPSADQANPAPPPLPPISTSVRTASVPPISAGPPTPPTISEPPPTSVSPPVVKRRISPVVFLLLGVMLAAMGLGLFIKGELGSFLTESWEVAVLAAMCVLAYAGVDRPVARVFSWLLLGVALLGGIACNVIFAYAAVTGDFGERTEPGAAVAGTFPLLALIFLATALAATSALLARLRGFRRFCSVLTGETEWTSVRILALATVVSFTLICLVPLVGLGDPPILSMIQHSKDPMNLFDDGRGVAGMLRDQIYSLCWTLLAAALAVGYGIQRNWRETLDRLGLKRISIKQVGVAVILTGLLLGFGHLTDKGITGLWLHFGWPTTDTETVEALFSPFISPLGAVVIGITAGIGEEVAVRGILQPRLGILLSNLLFTSLHAYQYHSDGLLSVFLTGLALGFIRKKTCTTVSAIVHGGFDFVLIVLAAWPDGA